VLTTNIVKTTMPLKNHHTLLPEKIKAEKAFGPTSLTHELNPSGNKFQRALTEFS